MDHKAPEKGVYLVWRPLSFVLGLLPPSRKSGGRLLGLCPAGTETEVSIGERFLQNGWRSLTMEVGERRAGSLSAQAPL